MYLNHPFLSICNYNMHIFRSYLMEDEDFSLFSILMQFCIYICPLLLGHILVLENQVHYSQYRIWKIYLLYLLTILGCFFHRIILIFRRRYMIYALFPRFLLGLFLFILIILINYFWFLQFFRAILLRRSSIFLSSSNFSFSSMSIYFLINLNSFLINLNLNLNIFWTY